MAENRIIGRDYEQHILQNICEEDEARLIAVYGRRRVGKTYLVKYYCQSEFVVSGEYSEKLRQRNSTFAHFTKAKDALHTVLVTTYGLSPNLHSGSIYSTVTMDELFSESAKV